MWFWLVFFWVGFVYVVWFVVGESDCVCEVVCCDVVGVCGELGVCVLVDGVIYCCYLVCVGWCCGCCFVECCWFVDV